MSSSSNHSSRRSKGRMRANDKKDEGEEVIREIPNTQLEDAETSDNMDRLVDSSASEYDSDSGEDELAGEEADKQLAEEEEELSDWSKADFVTQCSWNVVRQTTGILVNNEQNPLPQREDQNEAEECTHPFDEVAGLEKWWPPPPSYIESIGIFIVGVKKKEHFNTLNFQRKSEKMSANQQHRECVEH